MIAILQTSECESAIGDAPLIRPLCVFAAGRRSFDIEYGGDTTILSVIKTLAFEDLPLEEHGWDFHKTKISRVGNSEGRRIYRLER